MKLFRKIYLQAALGMLLLSVTLLAYLLWEGQKQTLRDTIEYEKAWISDREDRFRDIVLRNGEKSMGKLPDKTTGKAVMGYAFRSVFGSRGALFMGDEEILNVSPYTYDEQGLEALEWKNDPYQIAVSGLQSEEGRKLFLFYRRLDAGIWGETGAGYGIVIYRDVTDILARTQSLLVRGLGFTALALLLIGAVLYRGIYRMLRPMMELKNAAAAIAGGAYESRVLVQGKDEIGALTVSFNQMAEKVEEHLHTLAVTNEKQRQLLGSLAHELKTPLTAVIGYAETLLTVRLSERNRARALGYIRSEGQRLARLSEKMLELTGLYESGEAALELREVPAAKLLARLADLTSFRLGEKELHLVTVCEPESLTFQMDEDLMMSLLMNLVDNACKASPEQTEIRVCANRCGITVEDCGKGIPEAELARVTEAFYMVDKSRAKSAGGVGLGLALCEQIAGLHGASLKLESEEGKGTKVSVLW